MDGRVTIEVNESDAPTIELILKELASARIKHPKFPVLKTRQLSILIEEIGEVAKDLNEFECHKKETAQVACVCIRMLSGD